VKVSTYPRCVPVVLYALAGFSCGGGNVASKLAQLPEYGPARCVAVKSQERPLIIEWPGTDKADVEAQLRSSGGLVAVHYAGCQMNVLRACRVPGTYRWVSTSREHESVVMTDTDQLYAQMPMAGPSLEGHLKTGKSLDVSTTIVGKYVADRPSVSIEDLRASGAGCDDVTHVVFGLTTGAFRLDAQASAGVGAKVGSVVGADSSATRESLKQGGDEDSCRQSKGTDTAPPDDCRSLLRLEVEQVKCTDSTGFVEGKGCVAGAAPSSPTTAAPPKVLAGDSRDVAFAQLLQDGGRNVFAKTFGLAHDARWDCGASRPVADGLASLGPSPDIVISAAQLRIGLPLRDGSTLAFEALAFVFPDGRLRWGIDSVQRIEHARQEGAVSPAIRSAVDHLVGSMSATSCDPALLGTHDVASLPLPPDQMEELNKLQGHGDLIRTICEKASLVSGPVGIRLRQVGAVLVGRGRLASLLGQLPETDQVCIESIDVALF
jgi:hypothetical protein